MVKTLPTWATGVAARVLGLAIAVALVAWLLVTIIGWREAAKVNGATVEAQGTKIDTTAALTEDGQATATARAATDTDISAAREAFRAAIEEANHREPQTAARDSRAVPASVRDAARQRRLARERSAGDQGER